MTSPSHNHRRFRLTRLVRVLCQIGDGAVVAGVVYGHTVTFVDGKWSMQIAPSTIGELSRGVRCLQ